jgi:antibiotic biosynthesis monooxygenase (ABM) superfamily enzyme
MTKPENSVTWIIKRRAMAGKEADLESWISAVGKDAVNYAGNLGQNILRPKGGEGREYVIIVRFDSFENLEAWVQSETRARWVEQLEGIVEGEAKEDTVAGMELWFDLCDPAEAPPKWKMALVIFVVLAPIALVLASLGQALLVDFHPHLRQMIVLFWTVLLMTYIVMPPVTKWLSPWLNK